MNTRLKYVVCIDERPEARLALRLACMKAVRRGGCVDMLHVIPPPEMHTLGSIVKKMEEERMAETEALLSHLAAEICTPVGVTPSIVIREGVIHEQILAMVQEDKEANLLVLGVAQDGANPGKRVSWLASQLGLKLHIPLLLVPGGLTDAQLEALV